MLWSVSIKAASLLGDHSEQGKIMGWMEGLRGVGVMSLAVFTMWVFSRFAPDDSASLKTVIIIYSVVYILLGILCWFFVSDNNNLRSANNEEKQSFQLSDILAVLRISTTWYCSMVIFGARQEEHRLSPYIWIFYAGNAIRHTIPNYSYIPAGSLPVRYHRC